MHASEGKLQLLLFSLSGNRGDGGFAGHHARAGLPLGSSSSSKVGLWFCKEPRSRDLLWDTSSTDSEEWEREEKKLYRRPPLVRTRTERVSLFDNFFDKEF